MKKTKFKGILLALGFVFMSNVSSAHTGFNSHSGILANLIALGIVLVLVLIFSIVSKPRKKK